MWKSAWRAVRRSLSTSAGASADTIYGLSSGRGRAALAVFRVSGPATSVLLDRCVHNPRSHSLTSLSPSATHSLAPRTALVRDLRNPLSDELVDTAVVLWFPGPKSYTGEDMAELHCHGSPACQAAVIEMLRSFSADGAAGVMRPAQAGEFTRRALENGKMNLLEVEGLSDLLSAETGKQRQQALQQVSGASTAVLEAWRTDLLHALTLVEAAIDFADDQELSLDASLAQRVVPRVRSLCTAMATHLRRGEMVADRIREGFRVALVGAPNVGKSSLINVLSQRDVAIVSDIPGTTRDAIEAHLNIGGYAVTVIDTAGFRGSAETADAIERSGMERARSLAASADFCIAVRDATDSFCSGGDGDDVAGWVERHGLPHPDWVVVNKADLIGNSTAMSGSGGVGDTGVDVVSCRTGAGIDAFVESLTRMIDARTAPSATGSIGASDLDDDDGDGVVLSRARHRHHVDQCLHHLRRFLAEHPSHPDTSVHPSIDTNTGDEVLDLADEIELRAYHLWKATQELGELTGRVAVDDVLARIFAEFCVGK